MSQLFLTHPDTLHPSSHARTRPPSAQVSLSRVKGHFLPVSLGGFNVREGAHLCWGKGAPLCLWPLPRQGMELGQWRLEKLRGIPCRLGALWEVSGCDEGTTETLRAACVAVGRTKGSHSEGENLGRG